MDIVYATIIAALVVVALLAVMLRRQGHQRRAGPKFQVAFELAVQRGDQDQVEESIGPARAGGSSRWP